MRLVVGLFVGAVLATPAAVQARESVTKGAATKQAIMMAFAECEARANPSLVADYVLDRERWKRRDDYAKIGTKACVKAAGVRDFGTFRADGDAMNGAWAEIALRNRDWAALEPRFAALPALDHGAERTMDGYRSDGTLSRERYAAEIARDNAVRALAMMSECVVRAEPAKARAVFTAAYRSAEESAAIAALSPAMAKCAGSQAFRLSPHSLRSALAYTYLRLTVAADPALKNRLFS